MTGTQDGSGALADAAVTIADRVTSIPPGITGRTVVAIDGRSGAGKTDLADALEAELRCRDVTVTTVHTDQLCPGWDGLDQVPGRLVDDVLAPLSVGENARFRRWDWLADAPAARRTEVADTAVLVVDGVGSGAAATTAFVDLLIWVTAPTDERHRRAMARDGATFRPQWDRWAAQENVLFDRDRPADRAGITLDTTTSEP